MDIPPTVDGMTATISANTSLTGQMLIAGTPVRGTGDEVRGFDPAAGEPLEPAYHWGDATNVDAACAAAAEAFDTYRATTSEQRAQFLEAIAANIEAISETLIARAVAESGLPPPPPRGPPPPFPETTPPKHRGDQEPPHPPPPPRSRPAAAPPHRRGRPHN